MENYLADLQSHHDYTTEEISAELQITEEEYEKILESPNNLTPRLIKELTHTYKISLPEFLRGTGLLYKKDLKIIRGIEINHPIKDNLIKQKTLTDRLYLLRKHDNLKQWQVAYAIGMTRAGYNHYERRSGTAPTVYKLHRISRLFLVSMDTFMKPAKSLFCFDANYLQLRTLLHCQEYLAKLFSTNKEYASKMEHHIRIAKDIQVALDTYKEEALQKALSTFLIKNSEDMDKEEMMDMPIKDIIRKTKSTIEGLLYAGVFTYEDLLITAFIRNRKVYALNSKFYQISLLDRIDILRDLNGKDKKKFEKTHEQTLVKLRSLTDNKVDTNSTPIVEIADALKVSVDEVLGNTMVPICFDDAYLNQRIDKTIKKVLNFGVEITDPNLAIYLSKTTLMGFPKFQWTPQLVNEKQKIW